MAEQAGLAPFDAMASFAVKSRFSEEKDAVKSPRKIQKLGMQRDFSAFSIVSKDTAEGSNTNSKSSIMGPKFKFGMQRREVENPSPTD